MRVCVIDDNAMSRDSLWLCLTDFGCEVVTAENGDEGVALIERARPDIVVTDLNMPGLSGPALIAALRSNFPHLPIVAISGDAAAASGGEAAARAADAFIEKPFSPRALRSLIETLVTRR
jgi:CheY-like chemotaxis protein